MSPQYFIQAIYFTNLCKIFVKNRLNQDVIIICAKTCYMERRYVLVLFTKRA